MRPRSTGKPGAYLVACLVLTGCASTSTWPVDRQAAFRIAAKACQAAVPGVTVVDDRPAGRLGVVVQSRADAEAFASCVRAQLNTPSAGRVAMPPGGSTRSSVTVGLAGAHMLVPVTINGLPPVNLLLDTGADLTVIRPAALRRLGVLIPSTAPKVTSSVVGGAMLSLPFVRLDSLRVGELGVFDIDVVAFDAVPNAPAVDGLLGANFLNHFRVAVDRNARQLTLEVSGPTP